MPEVLIKTQAAGNAELFSTARSWAVAWTKPRCEHKLQAYFAQREVPCFLPTISRRQVYKSGAKSWSTPLFPSYVFYDCSAIERLAVFESRKVVELILPSDSIALGSELRQIALALEKDSALREVRFGQSGRPVTVVRGPLKGLRGELVRTGSHCHLILKVQFLGKAAELAIDESCVEAEH